MKSYVKKTHSNFNEGDISLRAHLHQASCVKRQASLTQVWFSLVSMMLFTPSIMRQMSSLTHQHDAFTFLFI